MISEGFFQPWDSVDSSLGSFVRDQSFTEMLVFGVSSMRSEERAKNQSLKGEFFCISLKRSREFTLLGYVIVLEL